MSGDPSSWSTVAGSRAGHYARLVLVIAVVTVVILLIVFGHAEPPSS